MSAAPSDPPDDWRKEPFRVMVALGESITAGSSATVPQRAWPAVLAALISDFQTEPVLLENPSIGGNVISPRVPAYRASGRPATTELIGQVVGHRPDLLVLSCALNDARGGTPLEMFREELTALVRKVRQRCDPLIVLLGPYFMTSFDLGSPLWSHATPEALARFSAVVGQVARDQRSLFCNVYDAFGQAPWMLHRDGVHPNDLGHRVVANAVFETLARQCSCLALQAVRPW